MEIDNNENNLKIPGGTKGYVTPEYYENDAITKDIVKKQDYFALGATIFYLKYGYKMLNYKEHLDDTIITANNIIESLQIAMDEIKITQGCDKGFIEFLCDLIHSFITAFDSRDRLQKIWGMTTSLFLINFFFKIKIFEKHFLNNKYLISI